MNYITIYRTIFVSSFDVIDFNNFGVHWTSDVNFSSDIHFINEPHSKYPREGDTPFTFKTVCLDTQIDKKATEQSNLEYGHESEVVLLKNTILHNVEITNWLNYPITEKLNVGTRQDTWISD